MFKKSDSCKKSLKMTHVISDVESNKMDVEETETNKKDNKENSMVITID